ncbi:MAG TPA: glycosyltransferase family A protein [Polyangiales bacterium]|nr:glycosyltransferase family A protein [Polyangiales bacterium]
MFEKSESTAEGSKSAPPDCAVVVSTRNRSAKIAALIASVLVSCGPSLELVVVDQSEDSKTKAALARFRNDPRLRYVKSDARGTSRGRNLGAALTTAPIIAITDDDCIVPPDWLEHMVEPFERDPQVGVVFCNVDPVPVDEVGITPSIQFHETRTLHTLDEGWQSAREQAVLGAGMAVRRTAFDALRGFDELLGPGSVFPACEDNDLMWRALARDWAVHQTTETTVLHDGFRNMDELRGLVHRDCYGAGGAMAKYVRAGYLSVLPVIANGVYKLGVHGPVQDMLSRRFPRGFKRPYWLMQGMYEGLRIPIDATTLLYRGNDEDRARRFSLTHT